MFEKSRMSIEQLELPDNVYCSCRVRCIAFFSIVASTAAKECGEASLGWASGPVCSTVAPKRQTMTSADGAWRDSFLRVKSVLASVTSSRKQTHIVSAASAFIAGGAV